MRYNQPYGTPEPPLGSYPRYINGNPTTGTEGSIPPARAFDEDQIEIVTVIQNVGLTPNHEELDQLWQALQLLIAKKYITTPITKTVHGIGADFVDLHAAFDWLSSYTITATGSVTFMIAPGKWTYTATVELNHANANRVTIQGGALLGASPQPSNFSIGGYHLASDGNNHIIYLRSVYATELSFTGGVNGFLSLRPGVTLRYLLITGSQTSAPAQPPFPQGNGLYVLADLWLDGVAIWGFGANGISIEESVVRCATSLSVTVSYCGSCGITNNGGVFSAYVMTAYTILVSNSVCGLNNFGGFQWFGKVYVAGHGPPNGNAAIQCLQGGLIAANPGSQLQVNYQGMIVAGSATVLFESSLINNNSTFGLYIYGPGMVWVNNTQFSGNGQYDVVATEGGMVDASGCAMATAWTPPFNTYDINANGYIVH